MIPPITVHLLDSAQGHPLQTWTFDSQEALTMGRSPDNDIVVADPYVSRAHAYLKFDSGQWRLTAISRQQLFYEGQTCPEVSIGDGTICRLGPHGCYLRFGDVENDIKATIAPDVTLIPVLKLDREKLQQEVNQITDGPFFQKMKDAVRQRREQRQSEESQL